MDEEGGVQVKREETKQDGRRSGKRALFESTRVNGKKRSNRKKAEGYTR